jgi:monovalent cation:H+ antiporter-2, CPA2 family
MRACAFDTAKALVITMHGESKVSAIVKAARQVRKDIPIVVRAKDADHAHRLYDLGANEAVPETLEASLQLGEAILVEAGVPMGNIIVSVHEKRANMRDEILESSTATTPSERLRVLREKPRT